MSNDDRYSYESYMTRLLNLLLASGPNAAVVLSEGIAATLGTDGFVFGFYYEESSEEEFDFDSSAWNDTSWDGETHAETWSIFVAPTIFTRWP